MAEGNEETKKPGNRKRKFILLGIVGGTLVLAGLSTWYFFFRKGAKVKEPENDLFRKLEAQAGQTGVSKGNTPSNQVKSDTTYTPKKATSSPASSVSPTHDGFPLKRHSKGALVRQLQQALNKNYGQNLNVDGDFGPKTEAAVSANGFPIVVDFATFSKILAGSPAAATVNPSATEQGPVKTSIDTTGAVAIATALKNDIEGEDFWAATTEIKKIATAADYKNINQVFRSLLVYGQQKDITQAALDTFTDSQQQTYLILLFNKIGLKQKNGMWTLAGLGCPLTTRCTTTIRSRSGHCLEVPPRTIIGTSVCEKNGVTTFRTLDNQTLYVPTKDVSHV